MCLTHVTRLCGSVHIVCQLHQHHGAVIKHFLLKYTFITVHGRILRIRDIIMMSGSVLYSGSYDDI